MSKAERGGGQGEKPGGTFDFHIREGGVVIGSEGSNFRVEHTIHIPPKEEDPEAKPKVDILKGIAVFPSKDGKTATTFIKKKNKDVI